jgi:dolichol-phosphate mannosyltransferase
VVVAHRSRKFGRSKYGFDRIVKGLLDIITVKFLTGYGHRPQHLLGTIGLVAFLIGGLTMCYLAVVWCLSRLSETWPDVHLHETAILFYAIALFIIGAQFLSIGILGEMFAAYLLRDADTYSVAEYTSPSAAARLPSANPSTPVEG